jgi:hypothetical protein
MTLHNCLHFIRRIHVNAFRGIYEDALAMQLPS